MIWTSIALSLAALTLQANARSEALSATANVVGALYNISATFTFTGEIEGHSTGVKVDVESGLTTADYLGGPFLYHVHTNPIPPNGDCDAAFGHLDPWNVTESIVCDPVFPQYCQEGDLAGKFGVIQGTASGKINTFHIYDQHLRWFPEEASLIGRSVVIHSANKTRLACGNITSTLDGTASSNGQPTWKPSTYITQYPTTAPNQPAIIIQPFNGTTFPSQSYINALPYPLPLPAFSLREALWIKFFQLTHKVRVNNKLTTVVQPDAKKVNPFKLNF